MAEITLKHINKHYDKGDRCVTGVLPGKRKVAMVFQNYALYPTMNVRDNIEFGLKNRKVPKAERERLIKEISEIVGLEQYLNKKPQTLSGGQRQRVALARCMVKEPEVFLMDEPLSNLDAQLRQQMRTELIQLHQRLGTTFIYVTHDQVEAMSMGDRIIIMNKGEVQQADSPLTIYNDPANLFAAQFIGTPPMNILGKQSFADLAIPEHHAAAHIGFRPEKIKFASQHKRQDTLHFKGEIVVRETLGSETIYQLKVGASRIIIKNFDHPMDRVHDVEIYVNYEDLYFFDQKGERIRDMDWKQKQESRHLEAVSP